MKSVQFYTDELKEKASIYRQTHRLAEHAIALGEMRELGSTNKQLRRPMSNVYVKIVVEFFSQHVWIRPFRSPKRTVNRIRIVKPSLGFLAISLV